MTGDIDPQELSEFPSWCGEVEEYGLEEFEGSGSDDEGPSWETGAEKPPELEGEELERVDRQADLKESVLRKPVEGKKVEEYAHLTTKIVRDWRRRPGWTRRSRLVAREFKTNSPWTQEMFAPASSLGTVHSFLI